MKVSDIGYELSIRLGDPIRKEAPEETGLVFTADERLKYISRAYSKLIRILRILMRDYQPEFNARPISRNLEVEQYMSIVEIPSAIKRSDMFVHYGYSENNQIKNGVAPASYIEPKVYLSHKYSVNDVQATSFKDSNFKYTILDIPTLEGNKPFVHLLPIVEGQQINFYSRIEYMEISDLATIEWNSTLPITSDYIDLLIDLAAIQGMQDIARADKAQLIERSISQDWQILGQYGTYMKQTEGVKE